MKKIHIKTTDCSYDMLVRAAKRYGFVIVGGRKHCKVKTADGRFVTLIPRHSRLKRETARGIVVAFNAFGADATYS